MSCRKFVFVFEDWLSPNSPFFNPASISDVVNVAVGRKALRSLRDTVEVDGEDLRGEEAEMFSARGGSVAQPHCRFERRPQVLM